MKLIDLTHPVEDAQPVFPGDPPVRIKAWETIAETGYNTTRVSFSSHTGTHVDAPSHVLEEAVTVDRVELSRLYGPAALVDLAAHGALPPETMITREMLAPYADLFQPGARILCRTGWGERFGKPEFFEGFPSLVIETARWIASRGIWLLGMDTPSPAETKAAAGGAETDPRDTCGEVHRTLLGAGVVIVESLANLERLPERFTFIGFPLRLRGRDGSPIRAAGAVET